MVQGSEFVSLYKSTGRGQHSQTLTQDLVKSLGWEVIHQYERGAGVGARHWRLCGYAAFSQGIRGRANTAATPVENIWGQAGETEKGSLVQEHEALYKANALPPWRGLVGDLYYHSVFTARLAALKTPCFL